MKHGAVAEATALDAVRSRKRLDSSYLDPTAPRRPQPHTQLHRASCRFDPTVPRTCFKGGYKRRTTHAHRFLVLMRAETKSVASTGNTFGLKEEA
ncbi:hypothetical protein RB195_007704 [Necator americanus]|uniref:Uncharacterized protein n=1 Tax=Necator americanus TaxID=51031 RepID=A0ABR1BYI1_NECAM